MADLENLITKQAQVVEMLQEQQLEMTTYTLPETRDAALATAVAIDKLVSLRIQQFEEAR